MWPFKKKSEPTKVAPMDCIFNSILEDLKIFENWRFDYEDSKWEKFHNTQKNYSLKCYSGDGTAWIEGIHYDNCFTSRQQRIIYKKCQEIWRARCATAKKKQNTREVEILKSTFPACFKSPLDL